jgi:predicted MFS family arabinose efflux permease
MSAEALETRERRAAVAPEPRGAAARDAAPGALAFGGLIALAAAVGIGRFVYTPILPVMAEAGELTKGEAGLVASANFLGYLVGALLAAAPRLPGSRRTWLLWALAASAATTGAMGLVSGVPPFLVLRFAGGAASAFVLVFASALVLERLAAAGRNALSALHFAGVGAGIAVSAALVSGLLVAGAEWRALWLASAAASLAAVLAVSRLVPPVDGPDVRSTGTAAARGSAAGRGLAVLVAAYGLFGFGYVVTATFLVAIVRDAPETRAVEPLVWIVTGLAAAPSVALWTRVGERVGVSRAFAAACLVEAVGVAASVLWTSVAGVLVAAASLGSTFMGITALGLVGARRLGGDGDPRRTLALMTAAFGFGQILGPAFAGLVHDRTGSFVLPTLAAAGALVVAALLAARVRAAN